MQIVDAAEVRKIRRRMRPDLSGRAIADELEISHVYLGDMELGRRQMPERIAEKILAMCEEKPA